MANNASQPLNLSGKVAIVTGASRGLGYGFALELARRGAKIVAVYSSPSSEKLVENLRKEIDSLQGPSSCVGVRANLSDPASPAIIIREATAAFGDTIHIIVNNAGMELVKPITDIQPEDFDKVFHLNVRAPLLMTQAVIPHLPQNTETDGSGTGGGRIINIASVGARKGFASLSLYTSSKAALEGLTRTSAVELGQLGQGHTVNCVNPGPVQSDMLDNIPKDIVDMQKKQTAAGNRLGTVDDCAQIVAWLAGEESRWVTGQAISASGGLEMY